MSLGSVILNYFNGLWGLRVVPSCLMPGPGVIRAGGSGLVRAHKASGWVYGLRVVGLHMKGVPKGELFAPSRSWLVRTSISKTSRYQSIKNTENKEI